MPSMAEKIVWVRIENLLELRQWLVRHSGTLSADGAPGMYWLW